METSEKRKLDVCLSSDLIGNFNAENTTIVIIDIIRASSTICTAFHYGVDELITVAEVEAAIEYKTKGYITAGERNGEKLDGFDMGNSPLSFMTPDIEGRKLAITTTNGTKSIALVSEKLKNSSDTEIVIGAFVNYQPLFQYLRSTKKNVLLVCSGWKGNVSIEDTLFAGKLAGDLNRYSQFEYVSDASNHAVLIYDLAKNDLFGFIMDQSMRFKDKIGDLGTDIRYCLKENVTNALPVFVDGRFIDKNIKTGA
ncbi:MAG: 2-phosphosulfolactate phosphatase [Bacteroidota bacterium]